MGKIRVKTLGDEELEKEQKRETKKRIEAKKEASHPRENGDPVAVAPEAKDVDSHLSPKRTSSPGRAAHGNDKEEEKKAEAKAPKVEEKKAKKEKFIGKKKQKRSKKYQAVANMIDKNKIYKLNEALEVLPKLKISKFDETVELHINTTEKGISGNLNLPHGTGKKVRVVIASDELIAQIEKGRIDFDILLAEPSMMPKLARVARILGPRGLMPNPKNGTISPKPEELIKKYEQGQTSFKTEAKNPIIHLAVGKLSFGNKKLEENIKATLKAIQAGKIRKAVLKSTMSPGIKIDFSSI